MSTIKANAIIDAAGGNTATINGITPAFSSQAQAIAGTDNTTLMTPLRVQQNVDLTKSTRLSDTVVSNKTSSRATATTYQNTTSGWLLVSVCMTNNGQTFLIGPTSGVAITAISMNVASSNMTYLVPPSWYYRVTGTVISLWTEGQA